jgi:hypothetical protein
LISVLSLFLFIRMATSLLAARPSHSSGILPFFFPSFLKLLKARSIPSPLLPITVLVPSSMVIGLSVFSLIVKQGMPSAVVSSCMPPLSVNTVTASFHLFTTETPQYDLPDLRGRQSSQSCFLLFLFVWLGEKKYAQDLRAWFDQSFLSRLQHGPP